MDTPNISHITSTEYEYVYEPAEDSFLLLDALEKDMENILSHKPLVCVEIGVGSGVIITALKQLLKFSTHCIGIDISNVACNVAQKTSKVNEVVIDMANMNLLNGFKHNSIDMLIFNPPYVPSRLEPRGKLESNEMNVTNDSIVGAWAGGVDGCEIIDQILNDLDRVLVHNGVFYLLLLKENKPNEVIQKLTRHDEFSAEVLMERRIIGEHLFVLKIKKISI